MEFQPNTSLALTTSNNNQDLNLELLLEPRPSSSSASSSISHTGDQPRIFSCNYCQRKFYSSQALGGHQNAHKLERSLAKKSRQLSSVVRPHGGSNSSTHGVQVHHHQSSSMVGFEYQHVGRFGDDHEMVGYGRRDQMMGYGLNEGEGSWPKSYRSRENVHHQEEFNQLDLSLKL
ncbi:zinc finger protein [Macleaya cordata]|uniref:Zinc finger protein n=1 Tax=Macleaya cordata TaxID=56857 RepID=A0A200QIG9_MACCD|nr:zinc finger protein [Macleaya cordata]